MASNLEAGRRLGPTDTLNATSSPMSQSANPANQMLQDMLRERRSHSRRTQAARSSLSRNMRVEESDLDSSELRSSPAGSGSRYKTSSVASRRTSTSVGRATVQKEMGLREMQEVRIEETCDTASLTGPQHISRIDKLNFDLKLEVFHRRERNETLEKRVEELEQCEISYDELQSTHDQLLLEFEKQKLVLDDAVAHIINLEAQNEDMQAFIQDEHLIKLESRAHGPNFTGLAGPSHAKDKEKEPRISRSQSRTSISQRQESRSSGKSKSRSLHTSDKGHSVQGSSRDPRPSRRYTSRASLSQTSQPAPTSRKGGSQEGGSPYGGDIEIEEEDGGEFAEHRALDSPRLSILSESGFASMYGDRCEARTPNSESDQHVSSSSVPTEDGPAAEWSSQRETKVNEWMDARGRPSTPPNRSLHPQSSGRFSSINQMLRNISSTTADRKATGTAKQSPETASPAKIKTHVLHPAATSSPQKRNRVTRSYSSSMAVSNLGGRLPPTPDTMSTATIGGNSSTQSIVAEKSLRDHGRAPSNTFNLLASYERPTTSEGRYVGNSKDNDDRSIDSVAVGSEEDDGHSTKVERSDYNVRPGDVGMDAPSSFLGGSILPDQMIGGASKVRPPMTTRATDMVYNGEGYALVQPTRTISYPSPQSNWHSTSPSNVKRVSMASDRTTIPSPLKRGRNGEIWFTSPTKPKLSGSILRSPVKYIEAAHPWEDNQSRQLPGQNANLEPATTNAERPFPNRFRFLNRFNSSSSNATPANTNQTSSSRPRAFRSNSSSGGMRQERPATSRSDVQGKIAPSRGSRLPFLQKLRTTDHLP